MQPTSPFLRLTPREFVDAQLRLCEAVGAFGRLVLRRMGALPIDRPNVPSWFEACFEAYWKTVWKKFPTPSESSVTSLEAGYLLGYIYWFGRWIDTLDTAFAKVPLLPMPKLSQSAKKRIDEAWGRAVVPHEIGDALKELDEDKAFDDPNIQELIARLPGSEASKFCNGMSRGLLGPSGSEDGSLLETDATAIHVVLMLGWTRVIEFPSVTMLHRWLVWLLGRNRAENRKRVEKICERIGLRLRGRGAPRKHWPFEPRKKRRSHVS